jgi:adenylate cyclase
MWTAAVPFRIYRMGLSRYRGLHVWPALVGAVAVLLLLAAWTFSLSGLRESARERMLDYLIPLLVRQIPAEPAVLVVDIDRATLETVGPWPWPRTRLAQLLAAVAAGKPAVIGLDVLLADPDRLSPAVLAREIATMTGRDDLLTIASGLEDGDASIAGAIANTATLLGFVLETKSSRPLDTVPILVRGDIDLPRLWNAPGALGPTPQIAAAGTGLGLLSMEADIDGRVRRLPLLAIAEGVARPGFAVEAVRLLQQAGTLILEADPPRLRIGAVTALLDPDASIRIVPSEPDGWARRTISAAALLNDKSLGVRLADHVVLIGGGAPELGGLRITADSPVMPTVQIQADAVETLIRGSILSRPWFMEPIEVGAVAVLGLLCIIAALSLRPSAAVLAVIALFVAWEAAVTALMRVNGILLDPAAPPLIGTAVFIATAVTRYAEDEYQARRLRQSFEQYLAPSVVRRIAAQPALVRLEGEMREITAVFTDIEGFTAMTERASPAELVALLDEYLDAVSRAVTDHGGMVGKIIGDAVHAIFNAPLDLPDHTKRALDCALTIVREAEAIRATPNARKLELGRTRVGLETGLAIVGDVGGSRKLDYTAYGTVVNTAARLEAANKSIGSTILIGPVAASRLDPTTIRRIGRISLHGLTEPLEIFAPVKIPADQLTDPSAD